MIINVADDQFGGPAVFGPKIAAVNLFEQVLLQGFMSHDGIKKELPPFLIFLGAAAVTATLGHVIAPFLVKLREPIELVRELISLLFPVTFLLAFFGSGF